MKIIIPVAGAGTHLRPHTYTQPKPLIPIAGKTIIGFIMDPFIEKGFNEFIFVIGYLGEKIKNYIQEYYPQISAEFVVQDERRGTGHAIYLCKDLIKEDEDIFILYGDTICDFDIDDFTEMKGTCLGVKRVDDPQNFGVAEVDAAFKVNRVVEKPKIPKSNLAIVGIYKIVETGVLFQLMERDLNSQGNSKEYPLTEAIQSMIAENIAVQSVMIPSWFDCGQKENLIETNSILLNKMGYASNEIPFFDDTIIVHPVSIGSGCEIKHSIVGPNVTIAENTSICSSIISDSIIGSFSEIENVVIQRSLIGSDAKINGKVQSLNIGDNTELDLS